MSRPLLEIVAASVASALAAQAGDADRIELCENLIEDGTTPSHGTIAVVRDRLHIPVYVLIRPRAGDFLYDEAEIDVMCRDIEHCARLGCDGVVMGALDEEGSVDVASCRKLMAVAGTMGVTFHRAFDTACDQARALDTLIDLGCERVLTSGARATAIEGADTIAALVRQAGSRIRIMAGVGINAENVADLAERTGAREFHASGRAVRTSAMRFRNPRLQGLDLERLQTQTEQVRALSMALKRL